MLTQTIGKFEEVLIRDGELARAID